MNTRTSHMRGVLATLVAFVLVALAVAAPVHSHADPSGAACTVCQFSQAPAVAVPVVTLTPPLLSGASTVAVTVDSPPPFTLISGADGRAPPAAA
jgi:ABC-type amino acid transport substrate-binding protein